MNVIIIGLGSMGKRRIRCLNALGLKSIRGVDALRSLRFRIRRIRGADHSDGRAGDHGRPEFRELRIFSVKHRTKISGNNRSRWRMWVDIAIQF